MHFEALIIKFLLRKLDFIESLTWMDFCVCRVRSTSIAFFFFYKIKMNAHQLNTEFLVRFILFVAFILNAFVSYLPIKQSNNLTGGLL